MKRNWDGPPRNPSILPRTFLQIIYNHSHTWRMTKESFSGVYIRRLIVNDHEPFVKKDKNRRVPQTVPEVILIVWANTTHSQSCAFGCKKEGGDDGEQYQHTVIHKTTLSIFVTDLFMFSICAREQFRGRSRIVVARRFSERVS